MIKKIVIHKFLRKERYSIHRQLKNCYCPCPYCGGNMGYRYLGDDLYSVECSNINCPNPHRFLYAKTPYMAITNAGGERKMIKTDKVSDLMKPYKDTKGKPKLSLVPPQLLFDIAEVREYGNKKYPDGGKDNWKKVDIDDYKDALLRHTMKYLQDPKGKDEESGIEHYKHMACNIAFICELEKE